MFEQFEIENGLIIGNRNSMEMKVEGMVSNIFTQKITFLLKSPCKFMKSMVFLVMVGGIVYG